MDDRILLDVEGSRVIMHIRKALYVQHIKTFTWCAGGNGNMRRLTLGAGRKTAALFSLGRFRAIVVPRKSITFDMSKPEKVPE
jgi:hypothetical protein